MKVSSLLLSFVCLAAAAKSNTYKDDKELEEMECTSTPSPPRLLNIISNIDPCLLVAGGLAIAASLAFIAIYTEISSDSQPDYGFG